MFSGTLTAEALVADDDPIALDVLHLYLESLGYCVYTADDGNEAIATFRESADRIRLVVLDARMPGPPPVELYSQIRAISPSAAVLYCSGLSDCDREIRAIRERGLQLLPKPFNRAALQLALLEATSETASRLCGGTGRVCSQPRNQQAF